LKLEIKLLKNLALKEKNTLNKMRNFSLFVLLIVLFISCEDNSELVGTWTITNMTNENSSKKRKFNIRNMTFLESGNCILPKINFLREDSCGCSYVMMRDTLQINSCSPVFRGKFIWRIDSRRHGLYLRNDSLKILAQNAALPILKVSDEILEDLNR